MDNEISLTIEFVRELTEIEMNNFWDQLIDKIEEMNLYAGGGQSTTTLNWTIDTSNSKLSHSEIIDEIGDYLMENDQIILNFEIK